MTVRDRRPNPGRRPSTARFFRAVGPGGALPRTHRREVLFCGRSNVGKSSLLNALTGVRGLARTSRTPGRTREIHFYEQGADRFLVDLPGYGYAKVSIAARREWSDLIESYLDGSDRIVLAIVLVDSRHPPFDSDRALAASLDSREIPYVVALTKTDKLGSAGRAGSLRTTREALPGAIACVATSAKTSAGIADLARSIDRAVSVATGPGEPSTGTGTGSARRGSGDLARRQPIARRDKSQRREPMGIAEGQKVQ